MSGQPRPVDHARLARNHLQRTGDPMADRMLDVVTGEIEAGNAGANEIGLITGFFKDLFDPQASGIERANASGKGMPKPGQTIESLGDALEALDFSGTGFGDIISAFYFFDSTIGPLALRDEAATATRDALGFSGRNDASDAFRHAYWSFRMAQLIGPADAKRVGDGHERRPLSSYMSFSLSGPGQEPGELLMDLFNNHVGRQLFLRTDGAKDLAPEEVARVVRSALDNGQLQTSPFRMKGR